MMNHYCRAWIEEWCRDNGWTELFLQKRNEFWAFPPNAVMPLPIPTPVLRQIKAQKGLSYEEKLWSSIAGCSSLLAAALSYLSHSPMPLVAAFVFCAMIVANMEDD
jgi:hypothetical protein